MIFTMYFLSVFSFIAGQQIMPSWLLMGLPMEKPSSKGEISLGSGKEIASFIQSIIKYKSPKSNTFVVVFYGKSCYNVKR